MAMVPLSVTLTLGFLTLGLTFSTPPMSFFLSSVDDPQPSRNRRSS